MSVEGIKESQDIERRRNEKKRTSFRSLKGGLLPSKQELQGLSPTPQVLMSDAGKQTLNYD